MISSAFAAAAMAGAAVLAVACARARDHGPSGSGDEVVAHRPLLLARWFTWLRALRQLPLLHRWTRRVESRRLVAGLPALLEDVARGLRSGASMRTSLAAAAPAADDVLRRDLAEVVARLQHGVPLPDALAEWMHRHPHEAMVRVVCVALGLAATVGGSMAQAVDGVADTIRSELAMRAEVRALSSQAQASATLVAVLPVGFGLVAGLLDPRTLGFLVASGIGLSCLTGGAALNVAGFVWMRRITRGIS